MGNNLPVKHGMKGGLDRDTEYGDVREGNYVDAENTQFIAKGDNQSMARRLVLGNIPAFDKGAVVQQNKKFRLYLTADAQPLPFQDFFTFTLFRTNKVTPIYSFVQGPLGTVGSYRSAISGTLTAAGISNVITDGTDYIDIEITETPTYDYHIELSAIGNNNAGVDSVSRVITIQESIARNLTGTLYDIGGIDLNGDLFIFSTPRDLKPREISIASIFDSSGSVGVQTSTGHGLTGGEEIRISGTGLYDGIWLVSVISSVSFSLVNSTFTTALSNQGNIVLDYTGVGEIGVMTYSEVTDAYTYTRLLRSKELGFCREAQIDVDAEINALGKTLYFNQYKYQPPRVFYYNGDYVTDGALNFVSSENRYGYGSIAVETKNVLNIQTATLDLVSVNEGGAVKAGNKQYFIRLMGDEGSLFGTDFHAFTNNVNVYSAAIGGDPNEVVGDISGTATGKKVVLRASNLISEVYSQIELCVAEWFGDAVNFSVIRREQITGDTVLLEHTGFETERSLSAEEVNRLNSEIANIGGQRIVDNRLVYHDITYRQEQDLTEWASSFTHTVIKENVRGNGFVNDNRFGGYQDPDNVFRLTGYSFYEVHRFGVRVYFKDGGASRVFWIDDIRMDMEVSNISTPNRRVGMSTTTVFPYDLNISAADDNYYAVGVEFNNIDLDFEIDGVRVKDLVGRIEILRVELEDSTRDILLSGMAAVGVNGKFGTVYGTSSTDGSFGLDDTGSGITGGVNYSIYPFPFSAGQDRYDYVGIPGSPGRFNTEFVKGNYSGIGWNNALYFNAGFIISNDIIFGKKSIDYLAGDKLINFGRPLASSSVLIGNRNFIRDFRLINMGNAFPVPGNPPPYKPFFHDIRNSFSIGSNSSFSDRVHDFSGNLVKATYYTYARSFDDVLISLDPSLGATYDFLPCVAFSIPVGLDEANNNFGPNNPVANGVNTKEGLFYVSYQRPRPYPDPDGSKFGRRRDTKYNVVCQDLIVDENLPSVVNGFKVFGGDTYISRMQIKHWNNLSDTNVNNNYTDNTYALSFVSQSYVNPTMRLNDANNTTQAAFPANPLNDYPAWSSNHQLDQTEYDTSYNRKSYPVYAAYINNQTTQTEFPTRLIWSDLKPEGSFFDLYRSFPPLNFVDLNRSYGRVMHIEVLNDELFTLQHRSVQRQYFNTTGTLTSEPDELIVLGNAGVLGRKGMDLSAYGTRHKWSVVKGRTITGRDVMYWYNVERGIFVKMSGQGIEPVSVTKGMFNFFQEASRFLFDKDTPALGFGICGGWNERFQELRMTFRGHKDVGEWNLGTPYGPGSVVKLDGSGFDIIDLYEAVDFTREDFPKESNKWVKIPHTNKDFYNEFSIVYSEAKDTFTTKLSPKPLIYLPWRRDIITQRYGVWNSYGNFIENYGKFNVWYEVGSDSLSKEFFIEPVINYNSDVVKTFNAIYVNSDNPPDRVEFITPNQETFLVASDFEPREGMWVSEIKNDSTGTGQVDLDSSQMYGRYIRVKLIYLPNKEQSLRDVRIRLMFNARYLQT